MLEKVTGVGKNQKCFQKFGLVYKVFRHLTSFWGSQLEVGGSSRRCCAIAGDPGRYLNKLNSYNSWRTRFPPCHTWQCIAGVERMWGHDLALSIASSHGRPSREQRLFSPMGSYTVSVWKPKVRGDRWSLFLLLHLYQTVHPPALKAGMIFFGTGRFYGYYWSSAGQHSRKTWSLHSWGEGCVPKSLPRCYYYRTILGDVIEKKPNFFFKACWTTLLNWPEKANLSEKSIGWL